MTDTTRSSSVSRRSFLAGSAAAAGAAAVISSPFRALAASGRTPTHKPFSDDYGPLRPVRDQTTGLELIALPKGFEYLSFGWTGDSLDDGVATPALHDGMAAYRMPSGKIHLVRNHEVGAGAGAFVTGDLTYDPLSGGGNTNLVFDADAGQWLGATPSLAGTVRNCAGGATPWNTWLSCEETFLVDQERHGYTFEVPADGVSDAVPLIGLGRFSHEANAVDPTTGYVYETEDRGDSCLYRFVPNTYGDLAGGGTLQAMVLIGEGAGPNGVVNTGPFASGSWTVSWVDLDDPDPDTENATTGAGLRYEAQSKGAAIIRRGEGTWWGNGVLYVISTNGGPVERRSGVRPRSGGRHVRGRVCLAG